jgi:hypothetical protein
MFYNKKNIYFIKSATKLLGSGVISSIGIILFSSNTIKFLDVNIVVDLLIILQLHSIGLTITKLSFDTISYSYFLKNENYRPKIKKFIFKKSLILAIPILIFSVYRFNYIIGIFIFINVLLDQFSNLVINQLNYRHLFNKSSFLNFLSYPLFFLIIILFSYYLKLSLLYCVIIFFICLVLKFILSNYLYDGINYEEEIDLLPNWNMGFQQIFNYVLFKSDTIIISLPLIIISTLSIDKSEILEIFYLSRFPELVSGLTLALSVLYYPRYLFNSGSEFLNKIKSKDFWFYIFSIILLYGGFLLFWKHSLNLKIYNIIFYFFNGFFVVFCNLITFNLIKQEKYKLLFNNLLMSCSLGVISLIFFKTLSLNFYFAIVPIQMMFFIFYFLFYNEPNLKKN